MNFNKFLSISIPLVIISALGIAIYVTNRANSQKTSGPIKEGMKLGVLHEIKIGDSKVEIGQRSKGEIVPAVKFSKWNSEVSMNISYPTDPAATSLAQKDTIRWKERDKEVYFKQLPKEDSPSEPSSDKFEFDILLKEKPSTNIFTYNIDSSNLNFFYQPPLDEGVPEPGNTCTETECKDKNGNQTFFRPENVVGSYAVYKADAKNAHSNKTEADKYKVGKVMHIYRPKIIDASGKSIWGKLNIEKDKNELSVTVDPVFLASATYPVTIDPTFGYTSSGASNDLLISMIKGSSFTGAAGTGTSISARIFCTLHATPLNARFALYKHSDSTLVGQTPEAITSGIDWTTINFSSSPTLTSVDYVIVGFCQGGSMMYDSGSANQAHAQDGLTYPTLPDPATFTHNNYMFSIYVTYEAAASPTPTPSPLTTIKGGTTIRGKVTVDP